MFFKYYLIVNILISYYYYYYYYQALLGPPRWLPSSPSGDANTRKKSSGIANREGMEMNGSNLSQPCSEISHVTLATPLPY